MIRAFHHTDAMHPAYQRMTAFQINPMGGARRVFVMTIQGSALDGGTSPQEYFEPEESELAGLGRIEYGRRQAARVYEDAPFEEQSNELENEYAADTFHVRPLRGLVVRDANGQFYEAIGQRLRPLQRIARGPKGELMELLPTNRETYAFDEQKQLRAAEEAQEIETREKVAARQAQAAAPLLSVPMRIAFAIHIARKRWFASMNPRSSSRSRRSSIPSRIRILHLRRFSHSVKQFLRNWNLPNSFHRKAGRLVRCIANREWFCPVNVSSASC